MAAVAEETVDVKYLLAIIAILVLWLMVQRGCRGFGDRFRERIDDFREHRQERFEQRERIFDGQFFDRFRAR